MKIEAVKQLDVHREYDSPDMHVSMQFTVTGHARELMGLVGGPIYVYRHSRWERFIQWLTGK